MLEYNERNTMFSNSNESIQDSIIEPDSNSTNKNSARRF